MNPNQKLQKAIAGLPPKLQDAINRIVLDPVALAVPCIPVEEGEDVTEIIADLRKSAQLFSRIHPMGCCGLAANQLGYNKRIFVIQMGKKWRVFVNPSFDGLGKVVAKVEYCMSFPDKPSPAQRFREVRGRSGDGKAVTLKGLSAQAFQHELDHLNGVLI